MKLKRISADELKDDAKDDAKLFPDYYPSGQYTPFNVIKEWRAGFNIGNAMKYIARMGKKTKCTLSDARKILTYLETHQSQDCYDYKSAEHLPVNSEFTPGKVSKAWGLTDRFPLILESIFSGNFYSAIREMEAYIEYAKFQADKEANDVE
jgi:hypothetical protein